MPKYLMVNILLTDSVKKSVRKTAAEFMSLVPMFSRRLAQRDYDFILVNPVRKRILLKMYIMGMFIIQLPYSPINPLLHRLFLDHDNIFFFRQH